MITTIIILTVALIVSVYVNINQIRTQEKQEDYKINDALSCGQKFFGENRVQEAMQRWESRLKIHNDLELRLIGPLQTNKVKQTKKQKCRCKQTNKHSDLFGNL